MNRKAFFDALRRRDSGLFGTSLSQGQVNGCEAILDEAERRGTPLKQLAYILATAYHETGGQMQPVKETVYASSKDRNPSDETVIKRLEAAWKAGKLGSVKTPYWRKDADGKAWFGRGLVQITHKANYSKLGLLIGVDLVKDPSKALELSTAVKILFVGMELGSFTGKSLSDYICDGRADYEGARRIINGTDKAAKIAGYARAFERALVAGGYGKAGKAAATPEPVVIEKPVVADPGELATPASKSKTVWTWLLTAIGAPIAAFGNLDWRVQLAIVAVIVGFAIYGIKRRADLAKAVRDLKAEFGS